MNGPVIFMAKCTFVHPSLRGTNMLTRNVSPLGYCAIPNKLSYMDYKTWARWLKCFPLVL